MREAVIVSYARTGLAKSARGGFNMTPTVSMAAHAVKHAVERSGLDPSAIEDVYMGPAVPYWREELDKIVESRRPGVGVHNLGWRGASHLSILWLRLPLASNGSDVDMILGYDAVVGVSQAYSGIRAA